MECRYGIGWDHLEFCIVRSKMRWLPDRCALGWVDKGRVRVGGTTMRLPYVKISPSYHPWLNLRVMISRSEETLLTSSTWVAILWEMRNKYVWIHGGCALMKVKNSPTILECHLNYQKGYNVYVIMRPRWQCISPDGNSRQLKQMAFTR